MTDIGYRLEDSKQMTELIIQDIVDKHEFPPNSVAVDEVHASRLGFGQD